MSRISNEYHVGIFNVEDVALNIDNRTLTVDRIFHMEFSHNNVFIFITSFHQEMLEYLNSKLNTKTLFTFVAINNFGAKCIFRGSLILKEYSFGFNKIGEQDLFSMKFICDYKLLPEQDELGEKYFEN